MQGRDLVDTAALVTLFYQRLGLFHRAGAALAGAVEHVAHMAHEDAETLVHIAAAFAHELAHTAALAGGDAQVAVIVFNVLADALVVDLLRIGGNGAFDGNDAHDAGAHRGVRRMLDLAGGGMLMEGVGDFGVLETELLIDEQELKNAGGVRRQEIDLQIHLGYDDLHHKADIGDLM